MTKLKPEQQELLENWETEKWNEIINKINPPNAEAFELRFLVHSLLEAKDAEKADAVEKEREAMLAKVREMSMSLPNIQLNSKEIAGGYRACLSEMIHFLTSPHDQQ